MKRIVLLLAVFALGLSAASFAVAKPLTLKVDDKTSFKRNGPAEFADFKAGDRLNVQARACKAKKNAPTAPNAAPPALLAKRVTGHPAKNDSDSESEAGTTTTTP